MLFSGPLVPRTALRRSIDEHYRRDETASVHSLLGMVGQTEAESEQIQAVARFLVETVRSGAKGGLDAFLHEYELSTKEGVMLMCVAEALLRIPDDYTQEALIRDKISAANWDSHLGNSDSIFVNASTWALMLTGRVVSLRGLHGQMPSGVLGRLVTRVGEPVIREAVNQAMRIMGRQFVMGRSIEDALERAEPLELEGYRFSYDMLGEAARTLGDSDRFYDAYAAAIESIGSRSTGKGVVEGAGISVKLSALHPRYELWQHKRIMDELVPRVHALALMAAEHDIGFNIDAEEAARLDLSLDVIEAVSSSPQLSGWDGFGVVVQAYQKRAPQVIDWLADLARRHSRRMMVRLVKGAYWDSEIKLAQELALAGYPVFTRKVNTDLCYLACARKLLAARDVFYPQFATHNAHTIAAILTYADGDRDFEFQRLHGMGEELYTAVVDNKDLSGACRIYAPVGQHEDLLAYLVRRLLENGANSSFVNRIQDEEMPVEEIIADPINRVRGLAFVPHPKIPLPVHLYGARRQNFSSLDIGDIATLAVLREQLRQAEVSAWQAGPIINGELRYHTPCDVTSPSDRTHVIGQVTDATAQDIRDATALAREGAVRWGNTPVTVRADALLRLATLMEERAPLLMALAIREAGKSVNDALAEIREAVDFCRYYATQAQEMFIKRRPVHTGASNLSASAIESLGGGVFCCISPWNFPLAIFTGQIAAALAAGNAVLAKPAEQTPLMAATATQLMHEAGIPGDVMQLLPGDGARVGGALVAESVVNGVCFTGSTEVARLINRSLAAREGPTPPLIAETGGLNTMLVDSSALAEQVTRDVLISAFQSAGQRCSALRVLYVQDDVAETMLTMIQGAMDELTVGDPAFLSTDVGPVIDEDALVQLEDHIRYLRGVGRLIKQVKLGPGTGRGCFVGPCVFEIDSLTQLDREVFGPILHVIRFSADELDSVVATINATGYGLTHGIHTRIDETRDRILAQVRVGNAYVNRNQIGAVVGVQPFGGEGLSGTGPKAGGPHYLSRFVLERGDTHRQTESVTECEIVDCSTSSTALEKAFLSIAADTPNRDWTQASRRADTIELAAKALLEGSSPFLTERQAKSASDYLNVFAAQCEAELGEVSCLPGPTGERNELSLHPRGVVLCITQGSTAIDLIVQIGVALAAGNSVLFWHPDERVGAYLESLFVTAGVPVAALIGLPASGDAELLDVVADSRFGAISCAGQLSERRQIAVRLAASDGAIRPLIPFAQLDAAHDLCGDPPAGSPRYLHRFVLERVLSIDTTASGGNAGLFSLD